MKIKSIWRYPVKSMAGEQLDKTMLSSDGVIGDRCYAIHDGAAIRGAKKLPALMQFSASYVSAPDGITVPPVSLQFGKQNIHSESAGVSAFLSDILKQQVTLDTLRPSDDVAYYESSAESPTMEELRQLLGLEADEPLPDFSEFPPEAFQYATPPGTFFDAFPLLILTTHSLASLQAHCPESIIDERRFRPNLVIDTADFKTDDSAETQFIENAWNGGRLMINDAIIQLTIACPRCSMITRSVDELPADTDIMRKLVKANHHNLGIYGRVEKPGTVSIGDEVTLSLS